MTRCGAAGALTSRPFSLGDPHEESARAIPDSLLSSPLPFSFLAQIFKLVSLWFKHCRLEGVNAVLAEVVESRRVPSAKFLPLVWQISSRLQQRPSGSGDPSPFQLALNDLVEWLVRDHPFHTLYQLISLRNSEMARPRAGRGGKDAKRGAEKARGPLPSTPPPSRLPTLAANSVSLPPVR